MRNFVYIFPIVILLLQSCVHQGEEFVDKEFILINNTGYPIDVKFYNLIDNSLNTMSSVALDNNNEKLYVIENILSSNNNNSLPASAFVSDSVRIIIDGTKKMSYTYIQSSDFFSEPIERNPFKFSNYEDIGNDKFQFTFTEQDYEN